MTTLSLAPGLNLETDFVTKVCAILAQRRKGKTYTASVIAEQMVDAGLPWVALDPTGAWWGLRSSADGKGPGLPVVIFGGQHGDLPLERAAGRFIADLVLDEPGWYVLDLSLFESKAAEREFATAFAERLFRRKQSGLDFPLHLFVDEADMFVPQEREHRDDTRMLGAFQSIVRRGGLHGMGCTLISQRPALVNKSVLTQLDMLLLLRLVAGQDQDAVDKAFVSRAGSKAQRDELMGSLASLRLGEAWAWEPGAEPPLFQRVQINERRTFNSSATPKPGERRIEPRSFAEVDLAAIKEQMAETIEKAKADDPIELRKRIKDLEKQLANRPAAEPITVEVPVDVEVPTPYVPEVVGDALLLIRDALERAEAIVADAPTQPVPVVRPAVRPQLRAPAAPRPVADPALPADVEGLGKGEWKVLHVLAEYPEGRTQSQVAFLAGYSAKASTLGVILSRLRKAGLVEPGQPVKLTAAGLDLVPPVVQPTGAELLEKWFAHPRIGEGERKVLEVLIEAWPEALDNETLCDRAGYSPTASTIGVILSRLRKLGLVAKGARALDPDFAEAIS